MYLVSAKEAYKCRTSLSHVKPNLGVAIGMESGSDSTDQTQGQQLFVFFFFSCSLFLLFYFILKNLKLFDLFSARFENIERAFACNVTKHATHTFHPMAWDFHFLFFFSGGLAL